MAKVRCKETTMDSFYGKFLYEQVLPKDHFLVKLKEVIDWSSYTRKFITYYKGKGEKGQAPYNPTMILKMLLVSYLYNISERQTEVVVNENLPTKFFVGLGVNEKSPDHATLTLFKNRLIESHGIKVYEELFNEIIIIALEKGVKFGKIQVIDSVHTIADVNLIKDEKRKRDGKAARDTEAQWGTKGNKVVIGKDGKKHQEQELHDKRILGYDIDDLGQRLSEDRSPFDALAFPTIIWEAIQDIERWKKSEKWYKEKTIPWKRGWLLHGPPGTGKTSLVRAIGEYLDMPVISYSLGTFTDMEFERSWDNLQHHVPCIALIEDIDSAFDGRKNVASERSMGKPLSFDTLLNTIDGIQNSDGVFTIVTTNHPESLDDALGKANNGHTSTRPGRIDRIIKLTILDKECRQAIAVRILKDFPQFIDKTVEEGDEETGAQFVDRCAKLALNEFWRDKNGNIAGPVGPPKWVPPLPALDPAPPPGQPVYKRVFKINI